MRRSQGEKLVTGGETRICGVQGRDGAGGYSVGNDGPPPEREEVVQGHRYSRGVVEGVISCG